MKKLSIAIGLALSILSISTVNADPNQPYSPSNPDGYHTNPEQQRQQTIAMCQQLNAGTSPFMFMKPFYQISCAQVGIPLTNGNGGGGN